MLKIILYYVITNKWMVNIIGIIILFLKLLFYISNYLSIYIHIVILVFK